MLGQRHVICINGLPNNGKAFLPHELGWYLEFFHGAKVEYFEVERYAHLGSKEADAHALLDDVLSLFFVLAMKKLRHLLHVLKLDDMSAMHSALSLLKIKRIEQVKEEIVQEW